MTEQNKVVVMSGRKATAGVVHVIQAASEVREATTGRVLTLPKVWAVATAAKTQREGTQTAPRETRRHETGTLQPMPAEELGFYRKYTEGLLRRYVQLTMEAGRVSSLMGREVIGGKASSYRIHGFDDAVIFRLDVEKCLRKLEGGDLEIVRRVAIQEYTHAEAAELMGLSLRTVGTRYSRAIDRLTGILLETRLLEPLKGCQGAWRS